MNKVIIEVKSTDVTDRSGISQRTQKPYTIREQAAFISMPNGEYRRIELSLQDNQQPYPVGKYTPDYLQMVYVDRFNSLCFGRPVLVPAS